jgi:hypothetical protein
MGWCSATGLFDTTLDLVLKYIPEDKVEEVVKGLYQMYKDGDWDCEDETDYFHLIDPIRRKMYPHWYE